MIRQHQTIHELAAEPQVQRDLIALKDSELMSNEELSAIRDKLAERVALLREIRGLEAQQADLLSSRQQWRGIAQQALEDHGVTLEEVISPGRSLALVRARWAVIQALTTAGFGPTEIGRLIQRDHSAVLYALKHQGPYQRTS